jgi:uncharacterized damage-inducible protein DinB
MMTLSGIRNLIAYDEWANGRTLDAAESLDAERLGRHLGSSFPSIHQTIAHIVGVEWVWLRRWHGESPREEPEWMREPGIAGLRARLHALEDERAAFLDTLDEAALSRLIAYTNFRGERWEYSLVSMLLHLVNHSTYHRGQVATMLRQVGAPAPATDLLVYYDMNQAAAR